MEYLMPDKIGREFMRLTAHEHLSPTGEKTGVPQPPLQLPVPKTAVRIPLPDPAARVDIPQSLHDLFSRRRSTREYLQEPISLDELSFLLWATQGVKEVTDRPATLRPVPSAGARHAFETYLLINRVDGLVPALYRYIALEHSLIEVDSRPETAKGIAAACLTSRPLCTKSAVTFIWVAVTERMTWLYGERGYRFLHLDAGHVCQNLYLAADLVACGTCAIGGFNDENINHLLGLDGEKLFVIYLATVGKH
jgi:SagB-type dehydrogenase family enzyme